MMDRKVWDNYTARLVALNGATGTDDDILCEFMKENVLDAGCGSGVHIGRIISRKRIKKITGIDLGFPGLIYGKKNFPEAFFVAGSIYDLPFCDNSFDFIYSIDVIEHLERPLFTISEYTRVCRPGGFIFIQTPNYPIKRVYDIWHWLRKSRETFSDDPTHVSRLCSFQLKSMFEKTGLKVVRFKARNLPFQRRLNLIDKLRSAKIGLLLGQKIIVVAQKPGG